MELKRLLNSKLNHFNIVPDFLNIQLFDKFADWSVISCSFLRRGGSFGELGQCRDTVFRG